MKRIEQALSTFRRPPMMYNCAQTICAAFGREDLLESMKTCGGGRAPEGTCGALYGALQVAPAEQGDAIKAAFAAELGGTRCDELKSACRVPCRTCVQTAARLLADMPAS